MSKADKGWAMKRARPSKKVWCIWLGSNCGLQIKEIANDVVGNIKEISGKWVISLEGFVNHLSRECHIDIDGDVPTVYCRSSSVFQLFNNRRKLGRTKKLIAFLELSSRPLKLTAKAVKMCLNFTRVRVVKIVAEDWTLNWE